MITICLPGSDPGHANEPHGCKAIPAYIQSYYLEFFPAATIAQVLYGKGAN